MTQFVVKTPPRLGESEGRVHRDFFSKISSFEPSVLGSHANYGNEAGESGRYMRVSLSPACVSQLL